MRENAKNRLRRTAPCGRLSRRSQIAMLLTAVAGATHAAHATPLYWDGNGTASGNFGTVANWSTSSSAGTPNPSAVPGTTDDAIFNISTLNGDETITVSTISVLSLQFVNSGATSLLSASSIGAATGVGGISIAAGAGAVSLGGGSGVTMKLNGGQTWINNSNNALTIVNTVQNAVANTPNSLTLTGSGGVTFGSAINGSGTASTSLVINASGGVVTYNAGNNFDGGTTLSAGELLMGTSTATLGSIAATFTMNGGVVDFNATTASRSFAVGNLTGSGGTMENNGSTLATFIMGNTDTGGGTFAGSIIDNNPPTGTVTGTVALKKTGVGKISLSGSNTYSGGTTINGGSLIVNNTTGSGLGKGAVNLSIGGTTSVTLGGSGTIGGIAGASAANVTLTGASSSVLGILSPGALDGGGNSTIGTLTVGSGTVNNNVTFSTNTEYLVQLSGGSSDSLAVYGNLSLAQTSDILNVSFLTPNPFGTYTLATYTGTLTGVFNTVIYDGTSYSSAALPSFMTLSYGSGAIVLTAPEPTPLAGVAMVSLPALLMVRRRASRTAAGV